MRLTPAGCVIASWAIIAAIALTARPFVYSDQAYQLKALQQYVAGESPSLNRVVSADPRDLTRDTSEFITWWPPSTQLIAWPLVRIGISIGRAIQVVSILALLIGSLGWIRWWRRFDLPPTLTLAAALLLPWLRYASNALFQYSAEILAFAAVPWVLVLTLEDDDPGLWRCVAVGFQAGLLYWIKYSSVFITASVLAIACLDFVRRRNWMAMAASVTGSAIPIVALSVINRTYGGAANMLAASHVFRLTPATLVYTLGNPALMAADADSMLQYALTNPAHGLLRSSLAVAALGVPGGLTLAWLALHAMRREERHAALTLGVSVTLMAAAWIASTAVSFEARHVAGAAMAALPMAIAVARRRWSLSPPAARVWLAVAAVVYVGVPWAVYAPLSVATKVIRQRDYVTTGTHLYNPIVAASDAQAAVAAFRANCAIPDAIWFVPDPLTGLELGGRAIMADIDFESIEDISLRTYRGRLPVCALLGPKFEENGKGPAVRKSFVDLTSWNRQPVRAASYDVWVGEPGGLREGAGISR